MAGLISRLFLMFSKANNPYGYVPTMEEINDLPKVNGTVISTFSGVGGSSLGYKMAGFNVLASVEFLDYQAKTYRHNHKGTKVYEEDIRKLNPVAIMNELGLKRGELDIFDGSPPCSAFSTSGKRHKGWGQAKKYGNRKQVVDDLFFEYTRFLKQIQPKVFVAENVSGLIKGSAKGYFKEIIGALKMCGYNVKAKVLNAKYYGVPQARERLIFIGVRNDLGISPSYPVAKSKIIPLKTAFSKVINSMSEIEEASIKKYAIYSELKKLKPRMKSLKYLNLKKESPDRESRTLTMTSSSKGAASVCHWDNRKFTVPESKLICTLPLDFELLGTWSNRIEACGRAVPPLMMFEIAKNIKLNILDKI